MPRLSIVIPCIQDAQRFEVTLASILQNRPHDCEVLVVQPRSYNDPYDLGNEVQFLEAPADASLVDLINQGIEASKSGIIHLVSCDVEVTDGWTAAAMAHFHDPLIGSVAPLIVQRDSLSKVVARGVHYGAGGRRKIRHQRARRWRNRWTHVVGPTLSAGFYRRGSVLDVGGFSNAVGSQFADVDLGLALKGIGMRSIAEEESLVLTSNVPDVDCLSVPAGRAAERLFWRNTAVAGLARSLFWHPWTIGCEIVTHLHRPRIAHQTLGRALAILSMTSDCRHRARLESLRATANSAAETVVPFRDPSDVFGGELSRRREAA